MCIRDRGDDGVHFQPNHPTNNALQQFAKKQGPLLKENIAWAAQTQVAHWMGVIAGWKQMLGADWEKTYAASNTIYVARQNNIPVSYTHLDVYKRQHLRRVDPHARNPR